MGLRECNPERSTRIYFDFTSYPTLQIVTLVDGRLISLKYFDGEKHFGNYTPTIYYRYLIAYSNLSICNSSVQQSYTLGRPQSFLLAHIDCKKPHVEDPNNENTCKSRPDSGFPPT